MRIPNNALWSLLAFLLAANIVLMIVLAPMGEILKGSGTDVGIFQFELAGSIENAERIMGSWRKAGLEAVARTSIWLDFAFLLAYPLLLAIAGWLLAASGPPGLRKIGNGMAYTVLACAPLDAVENIGMLRMLDFGADLNTVYVTTVCAALKWLLVSMAFACVVVQLIAIGIVKPFFSNRNEE
ncbi:hypothetical protein [Methylomonas sp. HYX-M1]|uniref:hypothetical protein n=1 Tax=Methylomonas sp. HYX-M1 TaxID=3139307 RepID=UPI00345B85C5